MKLFLTLSTLVSSLLLVECAVNEPCVGSGGQAGVCVSTSDCSSGGGISIVGACPRTADNIRCCTKASCNIGSSNIPAGQDPILGTDATGNCRWSSDCAGRSISGQCPGPSQFQCCSSSESGCGGYPAPRIPSVGSCKQVSVNGAKEIVDQFQGRIKTIGCIRTGAECQVANPSDHCDGMATDMMCSDDGGRATMCGRDIAEWVMDNRGTLKLKYVIWGQRIWETDRDSVTTWDKWRSMDDRHDLTQNHWDHVHVSYNG